MSIEVRVPTLGESVTEATVATWFKKPGDAVAVDEMLCELETDKVTVEVPSPAAGTLGEIIAGEGDDGRRRTRCSPPSPKARGAAPAAAGGTAGRSPRARSARTRRLAPAPAAADGRRGRALGEEGDGRGRPRPATRSRAPAATAG